MSTEGKKKSRTQPAEERRKQLIDATIDCISKYGISGSTLSLVTKKAGLSLGLVSFHFASKDELLAETLRSLADEHRALWKEAIERDELSASEKLRAIVTAQFNPRICSRKKIAVWFAFYGEPSQRKAYRDQSWDVDFERRNTSKDLCQQVIEEGGYVGIDAHGVALTLEGMFDGFWLDMLVYPEIYSREVTESCVLAYLSKVFPAHFSA